LTAVARARIQVYAPDRLPEFEALFTRLEALAAAKPPLSAKEFALDSFTWAWSSSWRR